MSHETRVSISSSAGRADHEDDGLPEAALLTDECKQQQLNYRALISEQAIIRMRHRPWFKFSLTRCRRTVSSSSGSAAETTSARSVYARPVVAVHFSRMLPRLKCLCVTTNFRVRLDVSSP